MTNRHGDFDLAQMQSLPLEAKIIMTQQRIRLWYEHWDGQVYVSFSGGKDSTVLKHIVDGMYSDVPAVFVNTGLEYPEIQKFAMSQENVITVRPEMRFDEVVKKYGYPVASKELSRKIEYARKGSAWAKKFVDGSAVDSEGRPSRYSVSKKWLKLMDAPFNVSAYCCDVMKKRPMKRYEKETGRKPILGTMASESILREQAWKRTGCNAFDSAKPKSTPMAFWTEQDVLEYIVKFNVPYCSVYGDIVNDGAKLRTTNCDRTGCMFCMFGCHLEKEPNRFQRMKQTHPKQYEYMLKSGQEGGLGMKEVLDFIGVKY